MEVVDVLEEPGTLLTPGLLLSYGPSTLSTQRNSLEPSEGTSAEASVRENSV